MRNYVYIVNAIQCYLSMQENLVDANTQKSSLLHMVSLINLHHLTQYQDRSRMSWVWQV